MVKKEMVLSHTSELMVPALSCLSSVERILPALSTHFLSKRLTLHILEEKEEDIERV